MKGKLILVIAPSGSGKGVLMKYVRQERRDILYPVSYTTRAMRPDEKSGEVYHFISERVFKEKIAEGVFLEWARYGGNFYGTVKEEIMSALQTGRTIVDEMEIQGVYQLQKSIPKENLFSIFIDAGSWETIEKRILLRAPIASEELQKRAEHFVEERTFMPEATIVVQNFDGKLEQAKKDFLEAIKKIEA